MHSLPLLYKMSKSSDCNVNKSPWKRRGDKLSKPSLTLLSFWEQQALQDLEEEEDDDGDI